MIKEQHENIGYIFMGCNVEGEIGLEEPF